jgi:UDP-N-acetylglucosamine 1-carboxyvinyltransferase
MSGAKNAALPILFASILSADRSLIKNLPVLADIHTTLKVLSALGLKNSFNETDHACEIDGSNVTSFEAPYDLVRTMRASVLVLGPLLARFQQAKVSLPGGCAIGARPVNFHLDAFEKMGATFDVQSGYIVASAKNGLRGANITFPFPSVGATENLMMGATLATGTTTLNNSACEPEIVDLAIALRGMGAKISGEGTPTITIEGVSELNGIRHSIVPDRVEAATFLCAGLITQGKVTVQGIHSSLLGSAIDAFQTLGAEVNCDADSITVEHKNSNLTLKPISLTTAPFPGFPTDMQAQFMALFTQSTGTSSISETIFENRFMHVSELARLGAKISIKGNTALITGPSPLTGATVMATDLRASASLIIAALAASGDTCIRRIYHLDRGYEKIEQKLALLGAKIIREKE